MAIKDCLVVGSCLLATAEYVCPVTIPGEVGVEFLAGRTMCKTPLIPSKVDAKVYHCYIGNSIYYQKKL
jgi:hypothetical protein